MLEAFYPTGIVKRLAHPQEKYELKAGVNLLIGANGSGKSSMLYAMKPSNNKKENLGEFDVTPGTEGKNSCLFFDFETQNPRTTTQETLMMQDRWNFGTMYARLNSQFMSHGECQKVTLRSLFDGVESSILFLDEPEQALDFDGLQQLKAFLQETKAPQVVIATHSPFLILEPSYHVIELTPGYRAKVKETMQGLLGVAL